MLKNNSKIRIVSIIDNISMVFQYLINELSIKFWN